jgi:hypothetical protein
MHKLIGAAAFAAALALPAAASAQAPQTSPFAALEVAQELQLTPQQQASITVARDSLREAHRIHCAPMHASTPTEAEEERHHAEMAQINARWEGQARAVLTPAQMERLAVLRPAPAAAAEEHGEGHHGAAPAAQGHGGHGGHTPATTTAPAAQGHGAHGGHTPAAATAPAAQGHAGHHPRR